MQLSNSFPPDKNRPLTAKPAINDSFSAFWLSIVAALFSYGWPSPWFKGHWAHHALQSSIRIGGKWHKKTHWLKCMSTAKDDEWQMHIRYSRSVIEWKAPQPSGHWVRHAFCTEPTVYFTLGLFNGAGDTTIWLLRVNLKMAKVKLFCYSDVN